jgi:hypothetical protein
MLLFCVGVDCISPGPEMNRVALLLITSFFELAGPLQSHTATGSLSYLVYLPGRKNQLPDRQLSFANEYYWKNGRIKFERLGNNWNPTNYCRIS